MSRLPHAFIYFSASPFNRYIFISFSRLFCVFKLFSLLLAFQAHLLTHLPFSWVQNPRLLVWGLCSDPLDRVTSPRVSLFLWFFSITTSDFIFFPCLAACGILVPWPGIKPMPPALGAWNFSHWTIREVPVISGFWYFPFFPSLLVLAVYLELTIFTTQIITMVWSLTQSQTSWNVKSSGP